MSTAPMPVSMPAPTIQQLVPQQEDRAQHDNRFLFTAWLPINVVFDLTGIPSGWINPGAIQPIVDWSYLVPNCAQVDRVRPGDLDVKLGPQIPFPRSAGTIVERLMANNTVEVGTEVGLPTTPTGLVEIKGLRGLNIWGNPKHHAVWSAIQQWFWPVNYAKYAAQFAALAEVSVLSPDGEVLGLAPELEARVYREFPGELDKFEDALRAMHQSLALAAAFCKYKKEEVIGELQDATRGTKGVRRRASPMDRRAIAWIGEDVPVAVPQQNNGGADLDRMANMFQSTVSTIGQMVQQNQGGGNDTALTLLAEQLAQSNRVMMQMMAMMTQGQGMKMVSPLGDVEAPVILTPATAPPPLVEVAFSNGTVEDIGVFTDDPNAKIPYTEPIGEASTLQAVTDEPEPEKPKNGGKKNGK